VSAETLERRTAFLGTFLGFVTRAEKALPIKRSVKSISNLTGRNFDAAMVEWWLRSDHPMNKLEEM
jgi:hypothetical protein